jgi:hypothetical protein
MDESSPVSGRPTVKAMAAFLAARFVQLAWLIGVGVMLVSGASMIVGIVAGAKVAFGAKSADKK